MANNFPKVWLGFEDECITDKNKLMVNFATNKIGGEPDWPCKERLHVRCTNCLLPKPLALQIYAPLDDSSYHRTLYLFACVNPECWNNQGSWTCIRAQLLEQKIDSNNVLTVNSTTANEWCQDADDWDDDNIKNANEENGNIVNVVERISDEDDESCSIEESCRIDLECLAVDDRNANMEIASATQGGAAGRLSSPRATAEIEGNEGEVISIDTPIFPQYNLTALLQEVTPLPLDVRRKANFPLEFVSSFITVWEEPQVASATDRHVKDLLMEYQQQHDIVDNDEADASCSGGLGEESYEKTSPAHGDKMFHYFITKIQESPGQILRYTREGQAPLLLYPLRDAPKKCGYCQGEMIFELQILPTIIPKLKLICDKNEGARLEFGTVLVFTCKTSCWSSDTNFRQESVVIQWEKN